MSDLAQHQDQTHLISIDWSAMRTIRVGVFDEHEIFRRGVEACLCEDAMLQVVSQHLDARTELDVAVVSPGAAARHSFNCPLVLCRADSTGAEHDTRSDKVFAALPRSSLTPEQLIAAVHAAAAGLRVGSGSDSARVARSARLTARALEVLRMLAEGAGTREISERLRYSDRTIKSVIHELERALGARSRAQAVAEGIRRGFI